MDEEVFGLNIIFISIVGCIFFLLYYAVPSSTVSQAIQNPDNLHQAEIEMDSSSSHDAVQDESHETEEAAHNEDETADDAVEHEDTQEAEQGGSDSGIIVMNNPAYTKHKKGLVQFTHETHYNEYEISCGACHHDETGAPLEDLKAGDSVQDCIECHQETEKPKGEKLDKQQRIVKYHFEAMHANCIGCHKPHNIEKGDPKGKGPAPTSCGACHPKK